MALHGPLDELYNAMKAEAPCDVEIDVAALPRGTRLTLHGVPYRVHVTDDIVEGTRGELVLEVGHQTFHDGIPIEAIRKVTRRGGGT